MTGAAYDMATRDRFTGAIDAANMMGADRLSLRQLADAFPSARLVQPAASPTARGDGGECPALCRTLFGWIGVVPDFT